MRIGSSGDIGRFTIEDLIRAYEKLDYIMRPYIVFMNKDDAEAIKACFPGIDNDFILMPLECVERGKAYQFKREAISKWVLPQINNEIEPLSH